MEGRKTIAKELFETLEIASRLDAIYEQVPSGRCQGCTACCSEAVNTFYSEYLNLCADLEAQGQLKTYRNKALRFYLTELTAPQSCPMLMSTGQCAIYQARPLPCRIYGHLERAAYGSNQKAVLEANEAASEALKQLYGFEIPLSVRQRVLPYCEQFESEAPMCEADRDDLVDLLFSVDSRFLVEGILTSEETNLSLVQWFAYEQWGVEEASRLRLKITKEILEFGHSEFLLQILSEIELEV